MHIVDMRMLFLPLPILLATFGCLAVAHAEDHNCFANIPTDQSIAACTSLIDAGGSETARAHWRRGNAYRSSDRPDEALADFDRALASARSDDTNLMGSIHFDRGQLNLMQRREPGTAIKDFSAALKIRPAAPEILEARGRASLDLGQFTQAIADFEAAVAARSARFQGTASPEGAMQASPAALNNLAWAYLQKANALDGVATGKTELLEKAMQAADQSLKHEPNFAAAIDTRGHILKALGGAETGERELERARQLDSKLAAVSAGLGRVTVRMSEKNLSAETVRYVADVAQTVQVETKAGDTLRTLATRVCGRNDKLYLDLLRERRIAAGADLDKTLDAGRTYELPYCLKLPATGVLRPGNEGKSVAELQGTLKKLGYNVAVDGSYGPATIEAVRSFQNKATTIAAAKPTAGLPGLPNAARGITPVAAQHEAKYEFAADGIAGPATIKSLTNAIEREGKAVPNCAKTADGWRCGPEIAYTPPSVPDQIEYGGFATIPLRADLSRTKIEGIPNRLASLANPSQVAAYADQTSAVTGAGDYRLFGTLATKDLKDPFECVPPPVGAVAQWYGSQQLGSSQALRELIAVLGSTLEKSREVVKLTNVALNPVVIRIVDSGITGFGTEPLNSRRYKAINFDPKSATPPPDTFGQHMHGTQVTSVALGTPILQDLMAIVGFPLRVAAPNIIRSIHVNGKPFHELEADRIGQELSNKGAGVANLSFTGPFQRVWFTGKVANAETLYVIAAGNDGALISSDYMPAHMAGPGQANFLLVGALNAKGDFASFSNFGKDHVQIAAPGCDVPVLEFNSASKYFHYNRANGTSMAAPLVSFTAAMIKYFMPDWMPPRIKRRLLVSADVVDEALFREAPKERQDKLKERMTKVEQGRILNAAAALALYDDVIRPRGADESVRGRLEKPGGESLRLCGEVTNWETVLRIIPRAVNQYGETRTQIMTKVGDDRWATRDCPVNEDELRAVAINFQPAYGAPLNDIGTLNKVRDVLLHEAEMRN